jgi:hypothetical protein
MCTLKTNGSCFEIVVVGTIDCAWQWCGLACTYVSLGLKIYFFTNLPVRMDLSNFASEDTSMKRTSAGSLFPALMKRKSPGTISLAITVTWAPSLKSKQLSGSIVVMDAMTREDDQSCHALNAAWMKNTASRTIASARFAWDAGSPRGFHDTKTRMDPTSKIDPNPLKKYPNIF